MNPYLISISKKLYKPHMLKQNMRTFPCRMVSVARMHVLCQLSSILSLVIGLDKVVIHIARIQDL